MSDGKRGLASTGTLRLAVLAVVRPKGLALRACACAWCACCTARVVGDGAPGNWAVVRVRGLPSLALVLRPGLSAPLAVKPTAVAGPPAGETGALPGLLALTRDGDWACAVPFACCCWSCSFCCL